MYLRPGYIVEFQMQLGCLPPGKVQATISAIWRDGSISTEVKSFASQEALTSLFQFRIVEKPELPIQYAQEAWRLY
jgi:hypothetical protein